jgi:hypothetical protein
VLHRLLHAPAGKADLSGLDRKAGLRLLYGSKFWGSWDGYSGSTLKITVARSSKYGIDLIYGSVARA